MRLDRRRSGADDAQRPCAVAEQRERAGVVGAGRFVRAGALLSEKAGAREAVSTARPSPGAREPRSAEELEVNILGIGVILHLLDHGSGAFEGTLREPGWLVRR